MLTLYYAGATLLQGWRIKNVCHKIGEKLSQQASIAFYMLPKNEETYDNATTLATSELCLNRSTAKICDLLWLYADQRGCCVLPRQMLHITPWISFPEAPSWLPFAYDAPRQELLDDVSRAQAKQDGAQHMHLLLEAIITPREPLSHVYDSQDFVKLEDYGKLLAWKIDSHLAIVMETDLEHFTQLLMATFLQNNLYINDNLPLTRIQSISYEGTPQPFVLLASHAQKSTRSKARLTSDEWEKHLDYLRALSVLAGQATEFEYNKNRTEGKTGIIKPDLIPQEKKAETAQIPTTEVASTTTTTTATPTKSKPTETKLVSKAQEIPKLAESPVLKNQKLASVEKSEAIPSKVTDKADITDSPCCSRDIPEKLERLNTAEPEVAKKQISLKKIEPLSTALEPKTTVPSSITASKSPAKDVARDVKQSSPSTSSRITRSSPEKLLNVLVYSESSSARENAVSSLKDALEANTYTVYGVTTQQIEQKQWLDNTVLFVVCGPVASNLGELVVDYFLRGGKVLSLCSDILHLILPTFRTAEVRENELVQFSYDKWQKVKMMHHIFCYQPSPVRKNFSTDSEDSTPALTRNPALVCPRSTELRDLRGDAHNLDVRVLGTEETWNSPSLLFANSINSGGRAVFSQVHLEAPPNQFDTDEEKFCILAQNEKLRLEILADLLGKHLLMCVKHHEDLKLTPKRCQVFPDAYFLGHHESKFQLLARLREKSEDGGKTVKTSKLTLLFHEKPEQTSKTKTTDNTSLLPILVHSCPEDFSTVNYFENLNTSNIGRLVIYAPMVSSSMFIVDELELTHGLAVLVRQQTDGMGRSNNTWLSPLGCAMFSIQLHISKYSPLFPRLPLIQHIVATAMVHAIKSHDIYKVLDISIKWPNDIYANRATKIGGLTVKTTIYGNNAVVNLGCGLNLDNSKPTTCINDLIKDYNKAHSEHLPEIKYEHFMAMLFNEIENLLAIVQSGEFQHFYKLYYDLWLHQHQKISICDAAGATKDATIVSIDDYGYLEVEIASGKIQSVQPDGNTFDLLKGLISPKFN